jgi:hypothetical protein
MQDEHDEHCKHGVGEHDFHVNYDVHYEHGELGFPALVLVSAVDSNSNLKAKNNFK